MSSFRHPHHLYLFSLKSGGKKLAWGRDPKDALETLFIRLTPEERADVIENEHIKIRQREMREYVHLLR